MSRPPSVAASVIGTPASVSGNPLHQVFFKSDPLIPLHIHIASIASYSIKDSSDPSIDPSIKQ